MESRGRCVIPSTTLGRWGDQNGWFFQGLRQKLATIDEVVKRPGTHLELSVNSPMRVSRVVRSLA
jgi:hypothetical protein